MLNFIPLTGQSLDQTRDGIRQNFQVIDTAFSVDHVTYNALTNEGKHNKVTLPVQIADPATNATEMAVYSKTVSGAPQLFIRRANNGSVINFTDLISGVIGETTLPSGIKLKWGRDISDAGGNGVVDFNALLLTNFTTIFIAQATAAFPQGGMAQPNENQIVARVDVYSNTGLTVRTLRIQAAGGNPQTANYTWFAIGV